MIYKAALIREEQALSVLRNYTTILIAEWIKTIKP
jgi:hypothetical protein